jgi:hypothetical protein
MRRIIYVGFNHKPPKKDLELVNKLVKNSSALINLIYNIDFSEIESLLLEGNIVKIHNKLDSSSILGESNPILNFIQLYIVFEADNDIPLLDSYREGTKILNKEYHGLYPTYEE